MRFVVGLALRGDCRGALRWATWLRERARLPARLRADDVDALLAVHVAEHGTLLGLAARAADEVLGDEGAKSSFEEVRIVSEMAADLALVECAASWGADGLVIGRRAKPSFARPGRTTRRLMRALPGPVAVVPADFVPTEGPILVGTDLRESSAGALRFAVELGERIGVEVIAAHVAEHPQSWNLLTPGETLERLRVDLEARAAEGLRTWRTLHAPELLTVRAQGDPATELLALARERSAAAVVVGSRRLGTAARLFTSSVGAELCGRSSVPVLVVPPE